MVMQPKVGGIARAYALALGAGLPKSAVTLPEQQFKDRLRELAESSSDRVLVAALQALEKLVGEKGLDELRAVSQGVKAAERVATLAPKMRAGAWSSPLPREDATALGPRYLSADGVPANSPMMALGLESAVHAGRTWQQRVYFNFMPGVDGATVKPVLMDTLRRLNERMAGPFTIPEEIQFTVRQNGDGFAYDVLLDEIAIDLGAPGFPVDANDPAFSDRLGASIAHEYGHALLNLNLPVVAQRLCADGALSKALAVEEACKDSARAGYLQEVMNRIAKEQERGGDDEDSRGGDIEVRHAQLRAVDRASEASMAAGVQLQGENDRWASSQVARGAMPPEILDTVRLAYDELFADACCVAGTNNLEANVEIAQSLVFESHRIEIARGRSFTPMLSEDEIFRVDDPHDVFGPTRRYLGSLFSEVAAVADRVMILKALLSAIVLDLEGLVASYQGGTNPLYRQDRYGRLAMDCGDVMPRNRVLIERIQEQLGRRS